jgi:hypothetical protein
MRIKGKECKRKERKGEDRNKRRRKERMKKNRKEGGEEMSTWSPLLLAKYPLLMYSASPSLPTAPPDRKGGSVKACVCVCVCVKVRARCTIC